MNGTKIPYSGWAVIGVRLSNEYEAEIRVSFLAAKEDIEQPIIGFNFIELMVTNTEDEVNGDKLLGRMMKSFHQSRNSDMQDLISIIRATNSDELCLVKSTKMPNIVPAGQTVRPPCRANTGPIHRNTPVIF